MSTLGDLIALSGAGMTGFLRGRRDLTDQQAEEEERAYRKQRREQERSEYDESRRLKRDLGDAWMTRAPVENMVRDPSADDRDVGVDAHLNQDGYRVGTQAAPGRPMTASGPSMTLGDATRVAAMSNLPQARDQRVADAYGMAGQFDRAMAVGDATQKRELATLQADEAKLEAARMKMLRGAVDAHRSGGWTGLGNYMRDFYHDGSEYRGGQNPDGTGYLARIGPDGQETGRQVYKDFGDFAQQEGRYLDPLKAADVAEQRARQKADDARKDRKLNIEENEAAAKAEYYRGSVNAAQTRADNSGKPKGGASAYERMDEADRLAYQSLTKQAQELEGEITKATLSGMAPPEAVRAARVQLAQKQLQARQILGRYGDSSTSAPDPLGLRGKPSDAAPGAVNPGAPSGPVTSDDSTRVDPKTQAARDRDGLAVVTSELAKARDAAANAPTQEARDRAQGDVASLERELALRGRKAGPVAPPTRPVATPVATAPVAAQPVAAVPAKAPAAPAIDPLKQQYAKESSELNRGLRTDFSPEVKQYIAQQKATEGKQATVAAEAYRQEQLRRARAGGL